MFKSKSKLPTYMWSLMEDESLSPILASKVQFWPPNSELVVLLANKRTYKYNNNNKYQPLFDGMRCI